MPSPRIDSQSTGTLVPRRKSPRRCPLDGEHRDGRHRSRRESTLYIWMCIQYNLHPCNQHWHRWGQHGDTVYVPSNCHERTFANQLLSRPSFFLKPIKPAPLFQVQIMGKLPAPLPKNTEGLQALFNTISKSTDIKLRNATWISEWQ